LDECAEHHLAHESTETFIPE